MLQTVVTVTVGALETIVECMIDGLWALKVYNAFMCGWSIGSRSTRV
jgi:hypothetical protein